MVKTASRSVVYHTNINEAHIINLGEMIKLKAEYVKIIENDPIKKARLLTERISENEYEIVKLDIPVEYRNEGIEEELLKEVTDDADNEGITLHVDINKMINDI